MTYALTNGKVDRLAIAVRRAGMLAVLVWLCGFPPIVKGQVPISQSQDLLSDIDLNGVLEDFDGVRPSLEIIDDSSLAAVKLHHRTDRGPLRGRRSEHLHIWGKRGGERILAAQSIVPVAVISELEVSSWVRGNRPGFQIMLRVRLPRSLDVSGKPLSLYLLGERYQAVGRWQQLRVANFDTQLDERIRAMRAELQQPIDAGEAYADQVVFNIFGGAGDNQIWIDDVAVLAGIPVRIHSSALTNAPTVDQAISSDWQNRVPQVAVYRGQPLADLARQGFNGVVFRDRPTQQQVEAANKHRLQIMIAPAAKQAAGLESAPKSNLKSKWIRHARAPLAARIHPVSWKAQFPDLGNEREPSEIAANGVQTTGSQDWTDLSEVDVVRWLPLRKRLREAVFSGSQGFIFDPVHFSENQGYRNAVAELVNLELKLFQPWIRRQESMEKIVRRRADSSVAYMAMFGQHAGLLWVPREEAGTGTRVAMSAIDIPVSLNRQAHFLAPGLLSPAHGRRIPGGIRVSLDRNNPYGLLLLTNQPKVLKAYAHQLMASGDRYNELFVRVIRFELLRLDHDLSADIRDPEHVAHLRQEVHALHSRIAPVLESPEAQVNFQQLDHFLGQLERVQQTMAVQPQEKSG